MKTVWIVCAAFLCSLLMLSAANAQRIRFANQPQLVPPAPNEDDVPQAKPSKAPAPAESNGNYVMHMESSNEADHSASCGDEQQGCGCDSGCCDSYSGWCLGSCLGDCCLGTPCTVKNWLTPCCCDWNYGGWIEMGYHSDNTGLSRARGDRLDVNDVPDNVNLQEAWLFAQKKAKTDACCCDWGFRYDIFYGTDGDQFQSFGNEHPVWDVTFDHGVYGWAMPQAYGEIGWNDWSVKIGRFFTPIGYEVVPATGNFFYSRSLTFYNSEPFGHTGVLGTYTPNDCWTVYAGWTLGWDTGFDQFGDGNNWLGGVSYKATDNMTFTYVSSAGNFGFRSGDEGGYSHSAVFDAKMSKCVEYVLQSDYVNSDGFNGVAGQKDEDFGINQYLFYTLNDCWKAGVRMEWWKSNSVVPGDSISFYELTGGINYRPQANITIRPEIRYDWTPAETRVGNGYNREIFGIDAIVTF
jgi:hypothetical protein